MGVTMQDLAQATGLTFYNVQGPFQATKGTLIGFKRNFLIAAGIVGGNNGLAVMARFSSAQDPAALLSALKADPEMKKMYTFANFKLNGPSTIVWQFARPMRFKADEFAKAIDAMAAVLSLHAKPFEIGKCEGDGCSVEIKSLTLANGVPNQICETCQAKVTAQQAQAKQEYERRQPNPGKALLFGLLAAVFTGPLLGLFMYLDIKDDNRYSLKLFGLAGILIALAVAWAVKTGVRRVTYGACGLASVLTLFGKVLCDTLFFGLYYSKLDNHPVSSALFVYCAINLWALKWEFNGVIAVLDVIFVISAAVICWQLQPKFKVAFQQIEMPAASSRSSGLTMSASV
jgi:hypothetical protein